MALWQLIYWGTYVRHNNTSCAQVHVLPENHCRDNWECALFSKIYIYIHTYIHIYIHIYIYICIYIYIYIYIERERERERDI